MFLPVNSAASLLKAALFSREIPTPCSARTFPSCGSRACRRGACLRNSLKAPRPGRRDHFPHQSARRTAQQDQDLPRPRRPTRLARRSQRPNRGHLSARPHRPAREGVRADYRRRCYPGFLDYGLRFFRLIEWSGTLTTRDGILIEEDDYTPKGDGRYVALFDPAT